MEKHGYVYKTTNMKTKKVYIGQRRGSFDPSYKGSGLYITRALNKYGDQYFKVEVLCSAKDKEELDAMEKEYIALYRVLCGKRKIYNLHAGGTGWSVGKDNPSHRPEVKKRISKGGEKRKGARNGMYGKTHSPEAIKKLIAAGKKNCVGNKNPMWGKCHTKESLEKMSKSHIGIKPSQEARLKMSEAASKHTGEKNSMYGKKHSLETRQQMGISRTGPRNGLYGKKHSLDSKIKMMLGHKIRNFLKKQTAGAR